MLTAPRTDPYERHYRIRLLPWIVASKRISLRARRGTPGTRTSPALCRARVEFRNVLLGPRSSLHHLRRGAKAPLCSAASWALQRGPTPQRRSCPACGKSPSRTGPPHCEDTAEVSRFSCMLFLNVLGSRTTPGPAFARDCRCRRCCLPTTAKGSAPECKVFEAQSPSPSMPLSTLRRPPRDGKQRKTRGQDGVAAPFL